jgi:hypothetical protein
MSIANIVAYVCILYEYRLIMGNGYWFSMCSLFAWLLCSTFLIFRLILCILVMSKKK